MGIKLFYRRIIYLIFIAVFLISLPLIFLYAQGYKYNFKKGRWQKTGVIFIDSRPKEINIFLNGRQIKESVPARIRKLLPNEYNLKITKAGYYDWEKKIKVNEGQTTFLQYIRLFRKDQQPKLIYTGKIKRAEYDQAHNIFVIQTEDEQGNNIIKLINPNKKEIREILTTKNPIKTLSLIENGKRILIKTSKNIWLAESNNLDKYNLTALINLKGVNNIKINPYNSNYIYYIYNHNLYVFNLVTDRKKLLLKGRPLDYLIDDNQLYYLEQNTLNNISLNRINLINSVKPVERLLVLPNQGQYKLVKATKNFIGLKEINKNEWTLLDKNNQQIKKIKNATYFEWSKDENQLIYGNQYELWVFKRKNNTAEETLITRSSQGVSNGVWLPKMTHIIYGSGNKIKAVENLAWNRQITDLFEDGKIKQIMLNNKGDKLFFISGDDKEKNSLFELTIQ